MCHIVLHSAKRLHIRIAYNVVETEASRCFVLRTTIYTKIFTIWKNVAQCGTTSNYLTYILLYVCMTRHQIPSLMKRNEYEWNKTRKYFVFCSVHTINIKRGNLNWMNDVVVLYTIFLLTRVFFSLGSRF